MAQPGIKQEPLSPADRMLPSCSQEIDLEEVLFSCWVKEKIPITGLFLPFAFSVNMMLFISGLLNKD